MILDSSDFPHRFYMFYDTLLATPAEMTIKKRIIFRRANGIYLAVNLNLDPNNASLEQIQWGNQ
jgi:hypothetical protein